MAQLTFILKIKGFSTRRGVYKKKFSLNIIKLTLNHIKFLLTLLEHIKFFINTAKLN
jgi:hypothetical protein